MQLSVNLVQPEQYNIKADCNFPNSELPVLFYKSVINGDSDIAEAIFSIFEENNWTNLWKDDIYGYHHYHSTTHEVLGISRGSCKLQVGGPDGVILELNEGDVIVLPAGMSHKKVDDGNDLECIGGYPNGMDYDMNYGKAEELEKAVKKISKVPMPETDPVYGAKGPLMNLWKKEK